MMKYNGKISQMKNGGNFHIQICAISQYSYNREFYS